MKFSTGCRVDPLDIRDLSYDQTVLGAPQVDWDKGYNIEKELNIVIPIKDQDGSSSCVGQAISYYVGVLNAKEVGVYDEVSAKAVYSQIYLDGGGAYIRDGMKLVVNWGSVYEGFVWSYNNGNPPDEQFMRDRVWKNEEVDKTAKTLGAKEYRLISACDNMDLFATAIRDNCGVVGGVFGENNATWLTKEPQPPKKKEWAHALYYGKFGKDDKGRYIQVLNSWGDKVGWQKLRESYFTSEYQFNPWTLVDRPNKEVSEGIKLLIKDFEKKVVIEGMGRGRKGIIVNGELREIKEGREASACLYVLANNKLGVTVSTDMFDEIISGSNF